MVGKKGLFTLYVFIYTILSIGVALFLISEVQDNLLVKSLGESQLALIESYEHGENKLFYLDRQYAGKDHLSKFFELGGFSYNPLKSEEGYTLWARGLNYGEDYSECYPTYSSFKSEFGVFLWSELHKNSDSLYYDYEINDLNSSFEVIGISRNSIDIIILKNDSINMGTYSIKPNVKFSVQYDIDNFLEFVDEVKFIVDECRNNEICWESNANFWWENKGNLFMFESIPQIINTEKGKKEVKIKAAVNFDEFNPLQGDTFPC